MAEPFLVESPDVTYSKDFIEAKYTYSTVHVCKENGVTKVGSDAGGLGQGGSARRRCPQLSPLSVPRCGHAPPASPSARAGRCRAWG